MDPHRLEQVEDRLQLLTRLKRKHGPSLEDVLRTGEGLAQRMDDLEGLRQERKDMEEALEKVKERLMARALELSEKRRQAAERLRGAIEKELHLLAMGNTRFRVDFGSDPSSLSADPDAMLSRMGPTGLDRAAFMICPNVGEELRPLSRIASGGELSRIMLALKTILAGKASVDTVVFDEVDAGIGGGTAETVGEKLRSLSLYHQILCITHLPQIASKGEAHYLVRKQVRNERTEAEIAPLGPEERVEEIARLLGGKDLTPTALEHARELLGRD
jgi:DNA repair protein RecN (Recombination protein N)